MPSSKYNIYFGGYNPTGVSTGTGLATNAFVYYDFQMDMNSLSYTAITSGTVNANPSVTTNNRSPSGINSGTYSYVN